MGFVPALPVRAGELEGADGIVSRRVEPPGPQLRLAEPAGPEGHVHPPRRLGMALDHESLEAPSSD